VKPESGPRAEEMTLEDIESKTSPGGD